jgi:phosphoribosylformylglycinamidine cyclo-ligase
MNTWAVPELRVRIKKGFVLMAGKRKDKYAEAGVDIDAGNEFVKRIKSLVAKTFKPEVITDLGGFAGLFSLNLQDLKNPVLLASTDGVGTKLKVAFMMDVHHTVGIDLVAMCVNDIVVQGATPLFMLDYIATGKLDLKRSVKLIEGIVAGCKEAECSLIGGETAEMPDFYEEGEYDLAGFVVGIADKAQVIDGSSIEAGHQLIGIGSSGLHSNGYSLARRVFFQELKMSAGDYLEEFGRTVGEELLEPTKIYVKIVKKLMRDFRIHGMAHITGGGLTDNVPRIIPSRYQAVVDTSSWTPAPIFGYLQKAGKLSSNDMMRTFNNGIGLVMIVKKEDVEKVILRLKAMGQPAFHIGEVKLRGKRKEPVRFVS